MLTIRFKSSKVLAALLLFMHFSSLLLIWLMPLSLWVKLLISPALLASAVFYLKRDALLTFQNSTIALQVHSDCQCEIQNQQGEWEDAELLGTSFVAPYLTVLNFKIAGKHNAKHVVIFPDAIDSEQFRKLRVLLKWKCNRFPRKESDHSISK